jgi:hypothetical protein
MVVAAQEGQPPLPTKEKKLLLAALEPPIDRDQQSGADRQQFWMD